MPAFLSSSMTIVVPTTLWTNWSGNASIASAIARRPLQCMGATICGENSRSASIVRCGVLRRDAREAGVEAAHHRVDAVRRP